MSGDPERPFCPLCGRSTMTLIATMTGERAMDIYLCPQCREQFTHEHRETSDASDGQLMKPVARVEPTSRARVH